MAKQIKPDPETLPTAWQPGTAVEVHCWQTGWKSQLPAWAMQLEVSDALGQPKPGVLFF